MSSDVIDTMSCDECNNDPAESIHRIKEDGTIVNTTNRSLHCTIYIYVIMTSKWLNLLTYYY